MVTLNKIMACMKAFGNANAFIERYATGQPSDMDAMKESTFPLMFVVYAGSDYDVNVKTYRFDVLLVGQTSQMNQVDEGIQLVSDMEQVAEDLIADIMFGQVYFDIDDQFTLTQASILPLLEVERNILTGCSLTLAIESPMFTNACLAPV